MELRRARGLLVSSITAAALACGGAEVIDPNPDAPAATGSIKVVRTHDGLALDVFVEQLVPPDELKKGAAVYVVWSRPARGGPAQNLGALALDADEGVLRTAIPAADTSVIITAEATAHAGAPSSETVLWAYVHVAAPAAPKPDAGTTTAAATPAAPAPAPADASAPAPAPAATDASTPASPPTP